jgi:hypothetical protein
MGLHRRGVRFHAASIGAVSFVIVLAVSVVGVTAYAASLLNVSGYLDHSYRDKVLADPTDGRPESKLWWNDGFWWGSLYNPGGEYQIYRLDWNTQSWVSTGVAIDEREDSRADVLWDSGSKKLYVASHIELENPSRVTGTANWGRLYRYSYDQTNKTYILISVSGDRE